MASRRPVWRNFDLSEKLTQVCAGFQLSMSNSWIGGVSEAFGHNRGDSDVLAHHWLSHEQRGVASAPAAMVNLAECEYWLPNVDASSRVFSVLCCVCWVCVCETLACLSQLNIFHDSCFLLRRVVVPCSLTCSILLVCVILVFSV